MTANSEVENEILIRDDDKNRFGEPEKSKKRD